MKIPVDRAMPYFTPLEIHRYPENYNIMEDRTCGDVMIEKHILQIECSIYENTS